MRLEVVSGRSANFRRAAHRFSHLCQSDAGLEDLAEITIIIEKSTVLDNRKRLAPAARPLDCSVKSQFTSPIRARIVSLCEKNLGGQQD
jgi:hypothetical protein